jgi:Tol biopolymer transport system component
MKYIRINIPALKVRSTSMRLTTLAALSLFVYLLFPVSGSMQKQADFSALSAFSVNSGGAFIGGSVAADGGSLAGATVVLSGAQNLSMTTDAGGNYFFSTNASTGNYKVTVSKNGFVFTPANQSVTLSGGGQSNVNFSGAQLCTPPSSALAARYEDQGIAENAVVCASGAVFTNSNPNGKIAFSGSRSFNNEIVTMNADGSNQTNITNNTAGDDQPSWSPDGSKIAFVSFRNSNFDIYTMNADGSNQIRLTTDASDDEAPGWSPDGSKITFNSKRTGGGDIYVMNADGSNQIRLTTDINSDGTPRFSPDGSKIVFGTNRDGNYEVYVINADGTNQTRLTDSVGFDGVPAFSPDGSKIAFHSGRTGKFQIFVMNADGSGQVNISNNSADDWLAAWSSDGTKIVFASSRDNSSGEIYTMNADGGSQTRLTNNSVSDYFPAWQTSTGTVSVAPASNVNLTFASVTSPGNTVATPLAANQLPALPTSYTPFGAATAYDIRTSASYTGSISVSYKVQNIADAQTCGRLRVVHFENAAWSAANNAAAQYNGGTQICTVAQTVMSLSPFAVIQLPAPTAANVSVGGRVLTAGGNGIRNVTVSLTDMQGNTRTALSSAFGYYCFDDIPAGGTVIINAAAKRYTFAQSQQILNVQEDTGDVNFTADDSVFFREQALRKTQRLERKRPACKRC